MRYLSFLQCCNSFISRPRTLAFARKNWLNRSARKWPLENFAQLCQRLLIDVPECWLVITGVASERTDAQYIRGRVPSRRCINFTGNTSFRELLALYSLARALITNDSGPARFAALLQLPTVVLFGPETPRLYSALSHEHKNLYAEFACGPCVSVYNGKNSPCTENRRLKAITTDEVLNEVFSYLRTDPNLSGTI